MINRNSFFIFLGGTAISLAIFLGLTWDTHRQFGALTHSDQLSDQVVAGKHVWESKNCNECHTILGFGIYYAPDLTRSYKRIGPDGIRAVVISPETVLAGSFRKMPNLNVSEQEASDLIAFLEWVSNIDNHDWPPQDVKAGAPAPEPEPEPLPPAPAPQPLPQPLPAPQPLPDPRIARGEVAFSQYCMGCHSLGGVGGSVGGGIGSLDTIGDFYGWYAIALFIEDPQAVQPNTRMQAIPSVSLEDRWAIGKFLETKKSDPNERRY